MKSKKKDIEIPSYDISLSFTNNLFQTYLFEIFDKLNITLNPTKIVQDDMELFNLIRVTYKGEISLLMFFDKSLPNYVNNNSLFFIIEKLQAISRKDITLLFYEINDDAFNDKQELIYFLNTEARVKVYDCTTSNDLIEFLHNYIEAVVSKEEKSKLTFFDSKPVAITSLCEMEGITDTQSLTWIKHLMCIPGVSENKAIAIAKEYPNFTSLVNVYVSCGYNEKEKECILKDIEVPNREKDKTTRLGIALSTKIFKVFNSTDPNIIIN
jgi:hypothetical protein